MGNNTKILRDILDSMNRLMKNFDNRDVFSIPSLYQAVETLKKKGKLYESDKQREDEYRENIKFINGSSIINANLLINNYLADYFRLLQYYYSNIKILKDNVKEECPIVGCLLNTLYVELTDFFTIYEMKGKVDYYTGERFKKIEKEVSVLETINTFLVLLKNVNTSVLRDAVLGRLLKDIHINIDLEKQPRQVFGQLITLIQDCFYQLNRIGVRLEYSDFESQEKIYFFKRIYLAFKEIEKFSFEKLCLISMENLSIIHELDKQYSNYVLQQNKFAGYIGAVLDCIQQCVNEPYWEETTARGHLGLPNGIYRLQDILQDHDYVGFIEGDGDTITYTSRHSIDSLMKKLIVIHKYLDEKTRHISPRRDIITNRFYGIANLLDTFSSNLSEENKAIWLRYFKADYSNGALSEFTWITQDEVQPAEVLLRSLKKTVDITISELTQLTPTSLVHTYYSYPVLTKEALFSDPTSLDKIFGNFLRVINQIERRSVFFLPTPMKHLKKIINSVSCFSKLKVITVLNEVKEFIEKQSRMPCLNTNRFTKIFYSNYASVFSELLDQNHPQHFSSDPSEREIEGYFSIIQSNADRLLKKLEINHEAELKAFNHLSLAISFLLQQVNLEHWEQKGMMSFFCRLPDRIHNLRKLFIRFHCDKMDTYQKAPSIWKIKLIKLFMQIRHITDKRTERGIGLYNEKITHFCGIIYQAFNELYESLTQQQRMNFDLIYSYFDEPIEDVLLCLSRSGMNFFDKIVNEDLFIKLHGDLIKGLNPKTNEKSLEKELNTLNIAFTESYSSLLR